MSFYEPDKNMLGAKITIEDIVIFIYEIKCGSLFWSFDKKITAVPCCSLSACVLCFCKGKGVVCTFLTLTKSS